MGPESGPQDLSFLGPSVGPDSQSPPPDAPPGNIVQVMIHLVGQWGILHLKPGTDGDCQLGASGEGSQSREWWGEVST